MNFRYKSNNKPVLVLGILVNWSIWYYPSNWDRFYEFNTLFLS